MKPVNASRKEVRKFGITFAILSLALAAFLYYKGNGLWIVFLGGSAFFLVTGFFVYAVLKPIFVGWMTFAYALGWVNTRIILGIVFYLIFSPIGVMLRFLGKDLLRLRSDKSTMTYWVKRNPEEFNKKRYEQLF